MSRWRWLWGALLLAVAVSRLAGLGDRTVSHDESLHAYFSHQLAVHGTYRHDPMMHGPLLFHLDAAVFTLLGANDATARLVPALAGIGVVLLLLPLGRWLGREAALAAAALVALSPSLLFYSRYLRNDIYIALLCLVWLLGSWRYLERRDGTGIGLVAGALGLALATKEVAFLFGLTAGLFFAALALLRAWRGDEPLRQGAAGDLALLLATLVLPWLAALLYPLLGWDPVAYDAPEAASRALRSAGGLALVAVVTAALWLRGRQRAAGLTFARWSVAAAAVWGGAGLLFTTFGTNFPRGLVSGYVGSLGYWLAQQPVERGGQPWFYYLLTGGLYEPLPLLLAAAGGGAILRRRWRRRAGGEGDLSELLLDFLLWWFVASALLYSAAGERMPWLLVHIALPASLVGGWTVARWAERCAGRRWRRALGAALLALALLATAGQAGRLAFLDYDLPTELLVYAHGTPELRTVERELTARASRLPPGERLLVAHDGVASWPLLWYLRDHDARYLPDGLEPELAAAADVVVLGPEGSRAAWPLLARGFDARPFRSVWWPLEGYRTAGLSEVKSLWTDPAARRAALSYLLRRRVPGVELADWPLRQDLRLHLRRPGSSETPVPLHSPPPVAILTPVFAGDPGSAAEAVAAGCGGRLVASEPRAGQAAAIATSLAAAWWPLPALTAAPVALACRADGRLAVAAGGELLLYGADGALATRAAAPGLGALAPAAGGGWWGADATAWRLCRFDEAGNRQGCRQLPFPPEALATGADGELWLADRIHRRLVRFAPGEADERTVPVAAWEGEAGRPGLAAASGHLFVSDPAGRRLLILSAAGELLGALDPRDAAGEPLFFRPVGVAVDPDRDRLWVADPGVRRLYGFSLAALVSPPAEPSRTGSER
ncbi:MAG: TIGR03663 family protein [Acidobacteria bacterium]|nr:TIGR03663 family protein [Thermoanaerobaculia bacterium]NLN11102.1 TIGR03663 family protein [Acidobacteriota bacterium]MBP7812916.1 TIGR03663 family protein [Thermoanaerobaculia bacterium]HPA95676.1 TIGR03663 family protein [Thermoanaerobaculia bacterium]HRR13758.1 TIGR03663 family protein [Thermoanaerobaculia bacterium]